MLLLGVLLHHEILVHGSDAVFGPFCESSLREDIMFEHASMVADYQARVEKVLLSLPS